MGIGSLVVFSLLIDYGLSFLTTGLLKWLGVLPICLGIKYWFDYYFRSKTDNSHLPKSIKYSRFTVIKILSICLLTISNGADNIGIYVPLFFPNTIKLKRYLPLWFTRWWRCFGALPVINWRTCQSLKKKLKNIENGSSRLFSLC